MRICGLLPVDEGTVIPNHYESKGTRFFLMTAVHDECRLFLLQSKDCWFGSLFHGRNKATGSRDALSATIRHYVLSHVD
jgi:hypothetical protein